jgi:hypothetical protein
MKIRVTDKIIVDVQTTMTMRCPAGTGYWDINYLVDGQCIHCATTGAIYGQPDVIAMLNRVFTRTSAYHYQDIDQPDPIPAATSAQKVCRGSCNGRPAWWTDEAVTHRQAIVEAYSQVVIE